MNSSACMLQFGGSVLPVNISNDNLQPKIVGSRFVFVRRIWSSEEWLFFNISIGNLQRKGFGLRVVVGELCIIQLSTRKGRYPVRIPPHESVKIGLESTASCARASVPSPLLAKIVSRSCVFQDLKAGILDSSHIQRLQRFQHRPSHSEYKPRWSPHSRYQYYRRLLRQNNNSSHHPD